MKVYLGSLVLQRVVQKGITISNKNRTMGNQKRYCSDFAIKKIKDGWMTRNLVGKYVAQSLRGSRSHWQKKNLGPLQDIKTLLSIVLLGISRIFGQRV